MTINVKLVKQVLDAIDREPHRWNQASWVDTEKEPCNTTMCFAGHALLLNGEYALGKRVSVFTNYDPWTDKVYTSTDEQTDFFHKTLNKFLSDLSREANEKSEDGSKWSVRGQAMKAFGINIDEPTDEDRKAMQVFDQVFGTTSGRATYNPDAFRSYVVSGLLDENLISTNQAVMLLNPDAFSDDDYGFAESGFAESDDDDEPPF